MVQLPRPHPEIPELEPIIATWELTADVKLHGNQFHDFAEPASDESIAAAEAILGKQLPPVMRALYQVSNGVSLFYGDLNVVPLQPLNGSRYPHGLTNYAEEVSMEGFEFPPELLLFGNNGGDEEFALWIPSGSPADVKPPVLICGEGGYDDRLAVVSTSLLQFLRASTIASIAAYISLYSTERPPRLSIMQKVARRIKRPGDYGISPPHIELLRQALDILEVPEQFRPHAGDRDESHPNLLEWINPDLPDKHPNPYGKPMNAAEIREWYATTYRA